MKLNWFDRAKERMKLAGVSQEKIADVLGCTRGAVGHYLSGRRNPTLSQLETIAGLLQLDPGWLVFGTRLDGVKDAPAEYLVESTASRGLAVRGNTTSGFTGDLIGYLSSVPETVEAFALIVSGNRWSPRLYEGEIVLISSREEAVPGDDLLVSYGDGRTDLQSLVRFQGDNVILDSLASQRKRNVTPITEIKTMHPVLAVFRATAMASVENI